MRIQPDLFLKLDFLDVSDNHLLALSASKDHLLIGWALGQDDHVASADVPTRVKMLSKLLLKASADLTCLVKGEPFGETD
jgi:hypothetical protein